MPNFNWHRNYRHFKKGLQQLYALQFSVVSTQHEHEERINFTIIDYLHWHSFIICYAFQVYTAQENALKTQHEYKHLNLWSLFECKSSMFLFIFCCSMLPVNKDFGKVFKQCFPDSDQLKLLMLSTCFSKILKTMVDL